MMDIQNNIWQSMSDGAIIENIGSFIKHHRLEHNKTQTQLAFEAGINRSTLTLIESGKVGSLLTLIQLLRALHQLNVLDQFQIKTQLSPIQLAKLEVGKRKRAGRNLKNEPTLKSDW
jgi:DNA-binding XRE family transcriptional regulator